MNSAHSSLVGEHILKVFQKELEEELWKIAEPIMRKKAEEIITSLAVRLVKEIHPEENQDYLKIVLGFPIQKVEK